MPIIIVDQEMYWQKPSQHGATKSPHTPYENRIPMSQRVIHPTKRTPASSSFANFEDQQTSRMERSIFATLVIIQSDHRHNIQQKVRGTKLDPNIKFGAKLKGQQPIPRRRNAPPLHLTQILITDQEMSNGKAHTNHKLFGYQSAG